MRHEQAAVHMADGYARSTGKVGTVLVTSGPGATNCITGSRPPIWTPSPGDPVRPGADQHDRGGCIPGDRHDRHLPPGGEAQFPVQEGQRHSRRHQEGLLHCCQPPGRWWWICPKTCRTRKRSFPISIPRRCPCAPTIRPSRATRQIKRAAKLLVGGRVMYVGGGAINANADHLVTKLAELLNLPVTTTLMGLGPSPAPIRNSSACWACTVPSKRTRPCTTRI